MPERFSPETMAMLAAREFADGDVVNLGVGYPSICCDYVPPGIEVVFHSEQGLVGFGPRVTNPEHADPRIRAMAGMVERQPGMSFLSHDESFLLVNSGRLSTTVLGALQVDRQGNLANYLRPGRSAGGIGGAGDLASHARRVIVIMTHVTGSGEPKIVETCSLPLTALRCVDMIVTDVAVMRLAHGQIVLHELAPGWTFEEVQRITGAELTAAADLREVALA